MYENFTDRARAVLTQAHVEAKDLQHEQIGIRHLMLALLEDSNSVCGCILKILNISTHRVRETLIKSSQKGIGSRTKKDMPLSAEATKVLHLAGVESTELGARYVGTEHILLSILRGANDIQWIVDHEFFLSYAKARAAVLNFKPEEFTSKADKEMIERLLPHVVAAEKSVMPEPCPQHANSGVNLRKILDHITFANSCINFDWKWEVEEVCTTERVDVCAAPATTLIGWHVNTTFSRPDINTGIVGSGKGRKLYVAKGTSATSVFFTCFVLAELVVKHELMEAIRFDGKRVLNPHHTLAELSIPDFLKASGVDITQMQTLVNSVSTPRALNS